MKYLDAKVKKMLIILGVAIVVLVVGALLINSIKGNTLSYEKIEDKLLDTAKDYYKDNENMLPLTDDDIVEVSDSLLSENGYMKELSKYQKDKNVSCSGKVIVTKSGNYYNYSPYLNCGDKFTTVYLYEKVLEDVVEKDDGLYKTTQYATKGKTENVYIYKGNYVNNYVSIDGNLWRIVKLDSNYNLMLVQDYYKSGVTIKNSWDNRYNTSKNSNQGINDYYMSIIRNDIKKFYDSEYISTDLKSKIVPKDLCVATRKSNDKSKNGKTECSKIIEKEYLGLLTISDFMNASLATNCNSTLAKTCSNYNYLTDFGRSYWLLTASSDSSYKGYKVYESVEESVLSSNGIARISLYITSNTIFDGGTGTAEDPYLIK